MFAITAYAFCIAPDVSASTQLAATNQMATKIGSSQAKVSSLTEKRINKRAKKILAGMTLRQKVGQTLFVGAKGNDIKRMKKYQYGGYLYLAQYLNDNSKKQFHKRIAKIQKAAKIDAFIGADEEGGPFADISKHKKFSKKPNPSPRQLYKNGGWKKIISNTKAKCKFMKGLGFNSNFAPVGDVPYSKSDYMWNRAFSSKPKSVSKYVRTVIGIMNEKGLAGSVKHFPGYGDNGNTHLESMIDDRSLKILEKRDLAPFRAGIKAGCPMIMVSHNIVKCFDPNLPASLSPKAHKYIRSKMKYKGIIISDSMTMLGVKDYGKDQADLAVKAFNAGNDIICVAGSDAGAFKGMLKAARSGKIKQKRLNASVLRILQVKLRFGIIK